VPPGQTAEFLAPLPVGRLWGVGQVTEEALRRIRVATIGDLARTPELALAAAVGASHARSLRALARGDDPREVVPDEAMNSTSAVITLPATSATMASRPLTRREDGSPNPRRCLNTSTKITTVSVSTANCVIARSGAPKSANISATP